MGKTAVPSQRATLCLETPVSAPTSIWRWLTYVIVSILKVHLAGHSGTATKKTHSDDKNALNYKLLNMPELNISCSFADPGSSPLP